MSGCPHGFFGIKHSDKVGITPASLRPGGATFWYRLTDSPDWVRYRGRWLSSRMLEIYIQEAGASTLLADLPSPLRSKVRLFAEAAGDLLFEATWQLLSSSRLPRPSDVDPRPSGHRPRVPPPLPTELIGARFAPPSSAPSSTMSGFG
eukprot:3080193-Pyramimonas_sp.AAC.1